MSMSVCLSVLHSHISETTRPNFIIFFCMLPVAVGRSSSDDVTICYVLPVLWMASCYYIMGPVARHVYF